MAEETALDRLREALKGKTRGWRGKRNARQHAEAWPEDVVAACDLVPEGQRTPVVNDLRAGCAEAARKGDGRKEGVHVQADDLFHLLDLAAPVRTSAPAVPAAPPAKPAEGK